MKNLIYPGFLICGLAIPVISANCSGSHNPEKKKYPFRYQTGLTIDGNLSDWASKSFCYNNDANVMYVVANDTSNLYFYIRMPERSQQISLLTDGFTLVFDPSGKKRETCVIRFQCGRPEDSILAPGSGYPPDAPTGLTGLPRQRQQALGFEQKGKPLIISGMMTCNGFKDDFNGAFPFEGDGNGFMAAVASDSSGTMILEGKAPLQAFPINPLKPPQGFTMGFTVMSPGGFGEPPQGTRPEGGPQGNRPGMGEMGGGIPGGGGMPGGGPGGGPPGGGGPGGGMRGGGKPGGPPPGGDLSTQPQKVRIWHTFSLAPIP